jgi:hypothetical protein
MQMFGHDDIVLHLYHLIVLADASRQFLLHHLPHLRELNSWCIGAAIGLMSGPHDSAQGLSQVMVRADGHMVNSRQAVIFAHISPSHVVEVLIISCLHDFYCLVTVLQMY